MQRRALLLLALLATPPAQARDLSAFNVLRLEMPAAGAFVAPREDWAFDASLGYQNTWSTSPNVREFFETRNARRRLDAADIAAIYALPGEKFLVDLEMATLDLALHRKLGERWSAFATLGLVTYGGGFMDGPIERYHAALGFREYVRGAVERNQFTVLTALKDSPTLVRDAPSAGFLDPVIGVRHVSGAWVIDGAAKIPLGGTRRFLSNGGVDVGVQVTVRGAAGAHSAFASAAGVSTAGGGIVETTGRRFAAGLSGGYEYAFGAGTSAFLHGLAGRHALDSSDTDLRGLRRATLQVTGGVRHRAGRSTFTFAFTEGFGAYNGLPDLGLQVGWTLD